MLVVGLGVGCVEVDVELGLRGKEVDVEWGWGLFDDRLLMMKNVMV
jgi:hypothetical protein